MLIETLADWNDLAKTLREFDYYLCQMQYDIDEPEGFHAVFFSPGSSEDIAIVTHSAVACGKILHYKRNAGQI